MKIFKCPIMPTPLFCIYCCRNYKELYVFNSWLLVPLVTLTSTLVEVEGLILVFSDMLNGFPFVGYAGS